MRQVISQELEHEDIRTVYEHIRQCNRCYVTQISAHKENYSSEVCQGIPIELLLVIIISHKYLLI